MISMEEQLIADNEKLHNEVLELQKENTELKEMWFAEHRKWCDSRELPCKHTIEEMVNEGKRQRITMDKG